MKSFVSPSFFRVFDLILGASNPGLKLTRWTYDSLECERERHSFTGPRHGIAIEIFTLMKPGKRGWTLMVVKEYWWAEKENKALKMPHWAKLTDGQRGDALAWLRAKGAALEDK